MLEEIRIEKLRTYLIGIIDSMIEDKTYQMNAYMLSNDANNYSIDKIPTESTVEKWVTGLEIHRDVYSFRSRMEYSQDTINNLNNVGFFERFEDIIKTNNEKGILPNIEGIEKIECLNCGTMVSADTNTSEFNIQIQITYRK